MNDRVVALIADNGKLLLVHRWKNGYEYYVLPGGGIEPGETLEQACIREVMEETGLRVTINKKIKTFKNMGRIEHYFLVTCQSGEPKIGSPEKERRSDDNKYELEWIDQDTLMKISLKPEQVLTICLSALNDQKKG